MNIALTNKYESLSNILDQYKEFVFFCGAGISFNSGIPIVNEIIECICKSLGVESEDIDYIFNNRIPFENFIEITIDETDISIFANIFHNYIPNDNHNVIAKLGKIGRIKFVFTTNFDTLIEQAFQENHTEYRRITENTIHFEDKFMKITL